jgi:hypothetical protein
VAEIRVEPKRRSLAWLWILLVLAVIAAVAYYLVRQGAVRVESTGQRSAPAGAVAAAPPAPLAAFG